jgi:ABC-type hemin transport system ATPase subunit
MPAPRRTHEATDRTIGAQADLHEYASKIHTLKFATGQSLDRLLEEPIANLDPSHRHDALRIAREIASQGAGVFVILHDLNLAAQYADRTILLKDGRIAAAGTPAEVISADRIREVFGVRARIIDNPVCGTPAVFLEPSSFPR